MPRFSVEAMPEVFVSDTAISRAVSRALARGQERIIVPTAYRTDYLGALKALSHKVRTTPLIRMLDRAQEYTHAIDWRDLAVARLTLKQTGAFAEGDDARLRMPKAS